MTGDTQDAIRALAIRFFDAIEGGDEAAIAAIYADDAAIWHNTDQAIVTRADNLKTLHGFIGLTASRRYTNRRLEVFPGGFVQQHLLVADKREGGRLALPACIVCAVAGGRITRLDEYFDDAAVKAWLAG